MVRFLLSLLTVALLAPVHAAFADPPRSNEERSLAAAKDEAARKQEAMARLFRDLEQSLLQMSQRLINSNNPGDREKAAGIRRALEFAAKEGIDSKFDKLIGILKKSSAVNLEDVQEAMVQNKMLLQDIRAVLGILLTDGRDALLKEEIEWLINIIKELNRVIREEKVLRANIEAERMDNKQLGQVQGKTTKATEGIDYAIRKKYGPDGKIDEKKNPGEHVHKAIGQQKDAERKFGRDNVPGASGDIDGAIKNLVIARDLFDKLLRQRRDEEIKQILATLRARCELMLAMQVPVYDSTQEIHKTITESADQKPGRTELQKALGLSDREKEIVQEADKGLAILKEEGTAVAFHEVFTQMRNDMKTVQDRLNRGDVGSVTQAIEKDIIDTLKEMIEALKKAHQQPPPEPPGPPPDGGPRPGDNGRLIDQLAELKMIRSMQVRLNNRTTIYGKQEQADDPATQKELRNLGDQQQRILEITKAIYTEKNK